MEYRDYYKILGVARGATADEIKKAYRRLARKFHPDVSKEKDAEARFKEVQEAYEVLKDTEKRAAYDQLGSNWQQGQQFRPPPDWASGFEFRGRPAGGRSRKVSKAASAISSRRCSARWRAEASRRAGFRRAQCGRASPRRARQPRAHRHRPRRGLSGRHAHVRAATAAERRRWHRRAAQSHREGDHSARRHDRAATAARRVRARLRRAAAGRAICISRSTSVRIARFQLDGRDVTLTLPIAPWEAALGGTVTVPTLGGSVEMRIPAGSQSGQKLRLRGRGLPGEPPGDQVVQLKIVVPPADTPEAKALYERMRSELAFDPRAEL